MGKETCIPERSDNIILIIEKIGIDHHILNSLVRRYKLKINFTKEGIK